MALTKAREAARALLRPLKQPLYDTGRLDAGANNRVAWFQAPQGQPIVAAGALKTEADTNLTQAGQLGRPLEFDLYAFQVELFHSGANVAFVDDALLVYEAGVFEFFFGQQRPWLQVPLTQIPNGLYVTGTVATADAGTPTAYAFVNNGKSSVKEYYDFTIGKEPVPIASAENFTARIDFPGGAVTTATAQLRCRCYMVGVLYSSL